MIDEQEQEQASGEIGRAVAAILAARYQPKVGDRVRLIPSGECQRRTVPSVVSRQTGIVEVILEPSYRGGHCVRVYFDEHPDGYRHDGVWAMPTELERLDP